LGGGGERTMIKIAFIKKLSEVEIRDCLLSFDVESFVFQLAVHKYKDLNIQDCAFTCSCVRV